MKNPSPPPKSIDRQLRRRRARRWWNLLLVIGLLSMIPALWKVSAEAAWWVAGGLAGFGLIGWGVRLILRLSYPGVIRRMGGGPGFSQETAWAAREYLDDYYDREDWGWEFTSIRYREGDNPFYEIRFTDCGRIHGILRLSPDEAGIWQPLLVTDESPASGGLFDEGS